MLNAAAISYDTFFQYVSQKASNKTPFFIPCLLQQLLEKDIPNLLFLGVEDNCELVGVCFIGKQRVNRLLPYNKALLNQTGLHEYDQIWIEYNDIVCKPELAHDCASAVIRYIQTMNYSQLYLSMTTSLDVWKQAASVCNCNIELEQIKGFRRNIEDIFSVEDVLQSLSPNSRAKVRRSLKLLTKSYGDISVETASSSKEVEIYYDGLSQLHKTQWSGHSDGSGFTNPHFFNTHKTLLLNQPHLAQLRRVKCGEKVIGYALAYVVEDTVFFYCSGIEHSIATGKVKPGYVMHCFLMAEYAKLGYLKYDFMGGESQYKKSLCNEEVNFYNITITPPTLKGKTLLVLKKCKRSFSALSNKLKLALRPERL